MTSESPYRLPRSVTPSHYAIELRLDPTAPTFDGTEDVTVEVHEPVTEIVVNGEGSRPCAPARSSRGDGSTVEIAKAVPDPSAGRITLELPGELRDRRVHPAPRVHRQAQRSDGGDVPLALHRRRGAASTSSSPRTSRRPTRAATSRAGTSPTCKASFQMTLVVPEDLTALTNTPEIGREPADPGVCAGAVRPLDRDVDLPRVCRGRASGPHRAVVRGADADPGRLPPRPAAPRRVRERGRRLRAGLVRRLLRDPVPRSRSSTRRRSRTSRRARWRTPGSSPTARRCCCSIPRRPPTSSSSTSPRRSRTSSRTCGSATSSRCAGGTGSG